MPERHFLCPRLYRHVAEFLLSGIHRIFLVVEIFFFQKKPLSLVTNRKIFFPKKRPLSLVTASRSMFLRILHTIIILLGGQGLPVSPSGHLNGKQREKSRLPSRVTFFGGGEQSHISSMCPRLMGLS